MSTVVSMPIDAIQFAKADADAVTGVGILMADIEENGLVSPILIDEQNNLIAGLKRLLACKRLEHTHINAKVISAADAEQAITLVNQATIHQRPCTREDLALLARRLRNNGLAVYDIARLMDVHVSTVYRYLAHAAVLVSQLEGTPDAS